MPASAFFFKQVKSSSIVASDAFEVANTLSQAGKDDKGGFYLRYLTPFRVNSTSNVTLTYVRTYGSDVKNVPVSSVYDSVKNSDGKVLYYDGKDLAVIQGINTMFDYSLS